MSFQRDQLHTHIEDGGIYRLINPACLMKHPDSGEWVAAVTYEDADPNSPLFGRGYCTTEERWCSRFRVRTAREAG